MSVTRHVANYYVVWLFTEVVSITPNFQKYNSQSLAKIGTNSQVIYIPKIFISFKDQFIEILIGIFKSSRFQTVTAVRKNC